MLDQFKQWMFRRALPVVSREVARDTVNPARSIQILFDGTAPEQRDAVAAFCKKLGSQGKKQISCLAFADVKQPVTEERFPVFTRQHLTWYGVPSGESITTFLSSKPDILLVFCSHLSPPLEYILATSNASLIVGPAIERAELYCHLLADVDDTAHFSLIIKSVLHAIDTVSIK